MVVVKLIKNRKFIYTALILLLATMVLNFPFPHEYPFGQTVFSFLNIPVRSVTGWHFLGITALLFLFAGLTFLVKSLKKYHTRFVMIAIIATIFIPPFVASSFQKTFATGIYAISYERDESICRFDMSNEETFHGVCELPFENYSKSDVQFTIEFYKSYLFDDDLSMVTLMNNSAQKEVRLKGKERKLVKVEAYIDVSQMESHIDSGEAGSVNIIIKSGEKIRRL